MKGSDKRIVDAADGGEYRAKSASDAVSKKHGRLDDQQSQISRERQRVAIVGKRKQLSDEGIAHRRVKFGEGKPNLIRDGMVFVLVIVAMVWLSLLLSNKFSGAKNKSDANQKIAAVEKINQLVESLSRQLVERTETSFHRNDFCSIFAAPSTIPNAGVTFFAGKNYDVGDVVFTVSWFLPMKNLVLDANASGFLAPYAILLKFHPTLSNINGTVIKGQNDELEYFFHATKKIQPGDEFFLSFENHPAHWLQSTNAASLFASIPTRSDYKMADEITELIKVRARQMEVAHNRWLPDSSQRLEINYLFALGQSVASKVNPILGYLIPSSRAEYKNRNMDKLPSYLSALTNSSLSHLQRVGSCVTDISFGSSTTGDAIIQSSRTFQKGDVIHVMPIVPFLLLDRHGQCDELHSKEEECSRTDELLYRHCLTTPDSLVALCSLTGFSIQAFARSTSASGSADRQTSNIAIDWSKGAHRWNALSMLELVRLPPGTLTLQVLALKPINVGDKLVLADPGQVAKKLIPGIWNR